MAQKWDQTVSNVLIGWNLGRGQLSKKAGRVDSTVSKVCAALCVFACIHLTRLLNYCEEHRDGRVNIVIFPNRAYAFTPQNSVLTNATVPLA